MTLYYIQHVDLPVVAERRRSLRARLTAWFRAPEPAGKDLSELSERDLADIGVREQSRTALLQAELRDIDRLGLGWHRTGRHY